MLYYVTGGRYERWIDWRRIMPEQKSVSFEQAAGQDAETYLETQARPFYDAVLSAVADGKTPKEIYSEVLAAVGPDRSRLAIRCKQFAAYLQGQGDG